MNMSKHTWQIPFFVDEIKMINEIKNRDKYHVHQGKSLKNMKLNLFVCVTLLPELHGQISKLQAPKANDINNRCEKYRLT